MKSNSNKCVIDGNQNNYWFHCVGVIAKWGGAIPGPLQKTASSMHLYIWVPQQLFKQDSLSETTTLENTTSQNVKSAEMSHLLRTSPKTNVTGCGANEPNDSGQSGEDCANITNSSGFWNDLPCTDDQYGIIEFD